MFRTKLLSFELWGTALPDTKMPHHQVIVTQKLIYTSFLPLFLYLFMLTYIDKPNKQAHRKNTSPSMTPFTHSLLPLNFADIYWPSCMREYKSLNQVLTLPRQLSSLTSV